MKKLTLNFEEKWVMTDEIGYHIYGVFDNYEKCAAACKEASTKFVSFQPKKMMIEDSK